MSFCREVNEWIEQNRGIFIEKRKKKKWMIYSCYENKGKCTEEACPDCSPCDGCGALLCVYLAKYVDDERICPQCWMSLGCPIDDRIREDQ